MSGSPLSPSSRVFVGYSTYDALTKRSTTLYDIDLIDRDLSNAFETRVNERVMRPDWGCKIWDWLMDQLTPELRQKIVAEATRICETDSRLQVQNVAVFQQTNGLRIEITLLYRPFAVVSTFTKTFEQRQSAYIQGTNQ